MTIWCTCQYDVIIYLYHNLVKPMNNTSISLYRMFWNENKILCIWKCGLNCPAQRWLRCYSGSSYTLCSLIRNLIKFVIVYIVKIGIGIRFDLTINCPIDCHPLSNKETNPQLRTTDFRGLKLQIVSRSYLHVTCAD